MRNKINDVDEFCKLFKINIPVSEEFDYYINTLKKSNEYNLCEIDRNLRLFGELEDFAKEKGYESVYKFKMSEIDRIKDILINTKAYSELMGAELSKAKFYSRDWLNQVLDGEYLMSLDFVSANYNVLKTFSSNGEFEKNWTSFCEKNNVHEALIVSKSFRQVVFGNTSPKRLQHFQQERLLEVVSYLKDCGYSDDQFVFVSHDETIIKLKNIVDAVILQDLVTQNKLSYIASGMPIKSTIFSLNKLKKNTFIKTIYRIEDNTVKKNIYSADDVERKVENYSFKEQYKTLQGVPGNKFFFYLKKYILNEPLDDRDLLYYNDGELCKFVDEESIKLEKKKLPHYEKPKYVITSEEAKTTYSFVWNEMSRILPNMSEEEKRRVSEILLNSCKSCFQAPLGCQCWNEE